MFASVWRHLSVLRILGKHLGIVCMLNCFNIHLQYSLADMHCRYFLLLLFYLLVQEFVANVVLMQDSRPHKGFWIFKKIKEKEKMLATAVEKHTRWTWVFDDGLQTLRLYVYFCKIWLNLLKFNKCYEIRSVMISTCWLIILLSFGLSH